MADLKNLARHREVLLLAEVAAWLHDYRKCFQEQLQTQAANKSPTAQGLPRNELTNRFNGLSTISMGYIFERGDCSLASDWRVALSRLQLGGERTYGWGRVRAGEPLPGAPFFEGWDTALEGKRPRLTATGDQSRLLAHAAALGPNAPADVRGAVEPLVGRETREARQHGKDPVLADICWKPGTPVPQGTQVRVCPHGVWEFV